MSALKSVADQLVSLCRAGQNIEAINTLYAPNIVSIEAADMGGQGRATEGLAGVLGKGTWWVANHEVHSASVEGPFPHGDDRFALILDYDVTNKPSGQRRQMREVAVYTVANGKIVREEFYYAT